MATAQCVLAPASSLQEEKDSSLIGSTLMPWRCCRRRTDVKQENPELGVPAPECPQAASPGGTVFQRSPATGLLRRRTRTTTEELDRFQFEQSPTREHVPPAYGSPEWRRCDDLW